MKQLTYKHTIFACYLTYITSAVSNNLVPLLFVTFNRQFGLSLDKLAFIITMNFGIQIFVDLAGAKFADRIGYKKLVMAAQLFDAIGLVSLGVLPNVLPNPYAGIILAALFYAVGSGLTEVVISPIVEAIPTDGVKASAMSLLHSFYCWGHVLMVIVTTMFFKFFGIENWSVICCLWAVLPIVNFVFYIFVPVAQLNDGDDSEPLPLHKLFTVKILWVFFALMLCSGAAEQAMSQWASFFAETELGVSKQVADLLGPCMFAVAMGAARVLFAACKKLDIRVGLLISALLCILSYLIAAFAPISFLALAGCTLCGFSVGILWPGVLSLSAKTYPAGGTAMFAILALAGDIGCFVGPEAVARASTALAGGGEPSVKTGLALAIVFPAFILVSSLALMAVSRKKR